MPYAKDHNVMSYEGLMSYIYMRFANLNIHTEAEREGLWLLDPKRSTLGSRAEESGRKNRKIPT